MKLEDYEKIVINGKTRTCGLLGNPVEHTMSPVIHNNLAAVTGQNLVYLPFHVPTGYVGDAVKGALALNLLGLNVTVPYKSDVLPFLAEIDPLAKRIGAVNTLVRCEGGFKGYNTDMPGLYRAMQHDGVEVAGRDVIILGAGGVARAVAMLLLEKGSRHVFILNRSLERARAVAEEVASFSENKDFIQAMALEDYKNLPQDQKYLVIQATSVGMHPNIEDVVISDPEFYQMVDTGYDLIFNPMNTKFMQLCKQYGARAFHGYRMLLYQGVIAYELWTGTSISDELAEAVYEKMLEALK